MIDEVTTLMGKEVFTHKGIRLGIVSDIMVDIDGAIIDELLITDTNPKLVVDGRDLSIPYRWVKGVSDIIVLRYFPGRVVVRRRSRAGKKKLRVSKRMLRRAEGKVEAGAEGPAKTE